MATTRVRVWRISHQRFLETWRSRCTLPSAAAAKLTRKKTAFDMRMMMEVTNPPVNEAILGPLSSPYASCLRCALSSFHPAHTRTLLHILNVCAHQLGPLGWNRPINSMKQVYCGCTDYFYLQTNAKNSWCCQCSLTLNSQQLLLYQT